MAYCAAAGFVVPLHKNSFVMDNVDVYRQVYASFKELCAQGKQPCSFRAFCRDNGVESQLMPKVLGNEFERVKSLPGYRPMGEVYREIFEEFRQVCAKGEQCCSFACFCRDRGVDHNRMHYYMKDNGLLVLGMPGHSWFHGWGRAPSVEVPAEDVVFQRAGRAESIEVPFEDVLFQEAGFLPADGGSVITVRVDGHVAVSFPADTDVAVVAKFVRMIGKEGGDVVA
ncbi:MAG: hypothetical protein ACI4BH_06480 [Muribaculaceae bacterium]